MKKKESKSKEQKDLDALPKYVSETIEKRTRGHSRMMKKYLIEGAMIFRDYTIISND